MKIRTGFVSNSSSSAFILIVKKEEFDRVYPMLDTVQKCFCDENFVADNVFGTEVKEMCSMVIQDYCTLEEWRPAFADRDLFEEKYNGYHGAVKDSIISMFAKGTYWSTRLG